MNTEEDEFRRIEAEAKRREQDDDDDTQVYADTLTIVYQNGYKAGALAEREVCAKLCEAQGEYGWQQYAEAIRARGDDSIPLYKDLQKRTWVGLTDEDWEHIDNKKGTALDTFAQGAVWAADQLKERNNG